MSDYGHRSYSGGSDGGGWSGDDHRSSRSGDFADYGGRGGGYGDYGDYRSRGDGAAASASYSSSAHDEPLTSGRARVPGPDSGDAGSRARGSARVGDKNSAGLSEEEADELQKTKKKRKRRRALIAMGCVVAMMLGIGTVVGTLFFQSVDLPSDLEKELAQNTTIQFADGSDMGKIGAEFSNRKSVTVLESDKDDPKENYDVPNDVKYTLLATEDRNFYEHQGVDFLGVMRALYNNVTGGDTQGASTLTQQYVGQAADIRGDESYMRKANEAVMAMKMDDKLSKEQIIEHYLNLVYMGRGAYGLGSAVEAWYGKDQTVKDLTPAQAALIFAQIKNPSGAIDPNKGKKNKKRAEARWEYTLEGMADEGWLDKKELKAALDEGLPKTVDTDAVSADQGKDKDTGFVSHGQVVKEAENKAGLSEEQLRTGGYTIKTTINPELQKAAVEAASQKDGSPMSAQDDNLRAGLVSVDPATGAVVAYFGGSTDGTSTDKAAQMHPPGSAFKEFTAIAALDEDISVESKWDGSSPREFESRETEDNPKGELNNAGGAEDNEPIITLRETMERSLNTPIYAITEEIGADKVVQTAYDLGIRKMQYGGDTYELGSKDAQEKLSDNNDRDPFDYDVGFGKFPVSVTDMASANATIAAEGEYIEPHFIESITDAQGNEVYNPTEEVGGKLESRAAIRPEIAADVTDVSKKIIPNVMKDSGQNNVLGSGQEIAGKSGTWERQCSDDNETCDENAHIWYAGFAPQLSAAVWVGDKEDENGSVMQDGQPAFGSGLSGAVWNSYMEKATQVKGYNEVQPLPEFADVGDKNKGDAKVPDPDDDKDEDEDDNKPCDPAEDEDCTPNPDECLPGTPGYPDCNGDGQCDLDPNDPNCQDNEDDCQIFCDEDPPDEDCPPGEDCNGDGQPDNSQRVSPTDYSATRPENDAPRTTVSRSANVSTSEG